MNLSEILKEGLIGKKVLEHHQTPPKGHPRLMDNCLMYVHSTDLYILIFFKSSKFPISINFTTYFEKKYLSPQK